MGITFVICFKEVRSRLLRKLQLSLCKYIRQLHVESLYLKDGHVQIFIAWACSCFHGYI